MVLLVMKNLHLLKFQALMRIPFDHSLFTSFSTQTSSWPPLIIKKIKKSTSCYYSNGMFVWAIKFRSTRTTVRLDGIMTIVFASTRLRVGTISIMKQFTRSRIYS